MAGTFLSFFIEKQNKANNNKQTWLSQESILILSIDCSGIPFKFRANRENCSIEGKNVLSKKKKNELKLFWNNSPVCHKEFSVFIIIRIQMWQNWHNHPQWQEWKRTHPREEWGVLPWEFLPGELSAAASPPQRVPMTAQSHIPLEFTLDNQWVHWAHLPSMEKELWTRTRSLKELNWKVCTLHGWKFQHYHIYGAPISVYFPQCLHFSTC